MSFAIQKFRQQQAVPSTWISVSEAVSRSGMPERTLRRRCATWQKLGRAAVVGGEWRIDPTIDPAFRAPTVSADQAAAVLDLRQVSAAKRTVAARKAEVLRDLDAFIAQRIRAGKNRVEAIDEFCARYGREPEGTPEGLAINLPYGLRFNRATLYRWMAAARVAPIAGLVDMRGLVGHKRNEPCPEALAFFQARFFCTNRLSLRIVYTECATFCDRKGLWWFRSYSSFRRWVHATYPAPVITLNREGDTEYRRRHEPDLEQDPDAFAAGELYVGDHHQFRAVVRHRGKLIRPWLSAWMDQRSLMFVGYVIVPEPNQTTILAAAKKACERFGPAPVWLVDNGRDYRAHSVAGVETVAIRRGYIDETCVGGLMHLLGAECRFALPYSPKSKIIEGVFRILEESFVRTLPNYCGADPNDRPEDFQDRIRNRPAAFPTLEEFAAVVSRWIDEVYHHRPQTGKYCPGMSPTQVWQAKAQARSQLADPRVLDLLDLVWSKPIKVTRNGIRFQGISYGGWDPQIIALQGREVLVTYDPSDISSVGVWDLQHRFICRAAQNALHARRAAGEHGQPVTDVDRREGLRLRRQLRNAMRIQNEFGHLQFADHAELALEAQRAALQREQRLIEPDAPKPVRNIRLVQTPLDGQSTAVERAFITPDMPPLLDVAHLSVPAEDQSYVDDVLPPAADADGVSFVQDDFLARLRGHHDDE